MREREGSYGNVEVRAMIWVLVIWYLKTNVARFRRSVKNTVLPMFRDEYEGEAD